MENGGSEEPGRCWPTPGGSGATWHVSVSMVVATQGQEPELARLSVALDW